jgi:HEAT repeat protein
MKRSRARLGLAIAVIVIAGGVAAIELNDRFAADESAEAQIRKLESFWPSRRKGAAAQLGQFPNEAEKAVAALTKALADPDAGVRLSALESLKKYNENAKPAAPTLKELLANEHDEETRRAALALVGVIKDQDAVPLLVQALDDKDPDVRLEATRSLGRFSAGIATEPICDKLISFLEPDQPVQVREASVESLASIAKNNERIARAIAAVATKDPSPVVRYVAVGTIKTPVFDFQIPTLIAAIDDSNARVKLLAGGNLAWIGMGDERIAPALCHAALTADSATREGIGINLDLLMLEKSSDKKSEEQVRRSLETAVRAFRTVAETREAGAREHVIGVLGRLIAIYQRTGKPPYLEPARTAVEVVSARVEDETEDVSLRLRAINQWSVIQEAELNAANTARSGLAPRVGKDELHARSLWIAALCRVLKSPVPELRSRAGDILMDSVGDSGTDSAFREAWRQAVPSLASAIRSEDIKVRHGVVAILTRLGPVAAQALPALKALAADTSEASVKSGAQEAIASIAAADNLKSKDSEERIAASGSLSKLGWCATPALPSLFALLSDPETKVRIAAANALKALGPVSDTTVPALVTAMATESDSIVRPAILEALDGIAPGTPPTIHAHVAALRDSDPIVRKAAARFKIVPADDSLVAALANALGDDDEVVRLTVAVSLSEVVFANAVVIPALLKALENKKERTAVIAALRSHLEKTADAADFRRVRGNLGGLRATLGVMIPALSQALGRKDDEVRPVLFGILGRIISFAGLSRDEDLRKAIEPALPIYLEGLDEGDPAVRAAVLGRLEETTIGQSEILAALKKFVDRVDQPTEERQTAQAVLKSLSEPADPKTGRRGRRGAVSGRLQMQD